MFRSAAIVVICVSFMGCRAPKPSMNVFAPYGSSRVPPPATGSMTNPNAYYQPPNGAPPAQAPTQTPAGATTAPSLGSPVPAGSTPGFLGASQEPTPADPSQPVALAAFEVEATDDGSTHANAATAEGELEPLPAQSISANTGSTLNLRGMPVNDATNVGDPRGTSEQEEQAVVAKSETARSPSLLKIINRRSASTETRDSAWETR